jgi:hypothetical protein
MSENQYYEWQLVQLGVNKPLVITCAAQLLRVLGIDGLTGGSFMLPSTSLKVFLSAIVDRSLEKTRLGINSRRD